MHVHVYDSYKHNNNIMYDVCTEGMNRGASQDFYKKMPKNTDISPILGIKCSNKIVQKGYDFIFFSLKESFSLVL